MKNNVASPRDPDKMKDLSLPRRSVSSGILISGVLMLAACGQKPATTGQGNQAGQWVAKVNGREITVHQVNFELSGANVTASMPAEFVQQRTVGGLVDRRLMVDAALMAGQDRAPDVVLAIERAKEQILAQAYLRQTLGEPRKPTAEDVADYFHKHPDLFAQRKQYEMRQLILDRGSFNAELKRIVDSAGSLESIEAALTAKNVKFGKERSVRTSAELPPPILTKIDGLLKGKPFVIRTSTHVIVATMAFQKDLPMTQEEAAPIIEQQLLNQKAREATTAAIARLRAKAKLEYKAGYGPAPSSTAQTTSAPTVGDRAAAGLR